MSTSDLDQIATDLRYAAGGGARELATGVVAGGKAESELGQRVAMPGPGLVALAGTKAARRLQASGQAQGTAAPTGVVTDHMMTKLADGGAALAVGQRP